MEAMPMVHHGFKCLFAHEDRFRGIEAWEKFAIIMEGRYADLLAIATNGKMRFAWRNFVLFIWIWASSTIRASNSNFLCDCH
jgi:hypothetical protein